MKSVISKDLCELTEVVFQETNSDHEEHSWKAVKAL